MNRILIRRYPWKVTEDRISFDDLLQWDMWQSFLKIYEGSHIIVYYNNKNNDHFLFTQLIYQSLNFLAVLKLYLHLLDGLWKTSVLRLILVVSL